MARTTIALPMTPEEWPVVARLVREHESALKEKLVTLAAFASDDLRQMELAWLLSAKVTAIEAALLAAEGT